MSEDLQKVKTLLKVRGCSGRTVTTYISCINRFKNYFEGRDLEDLNEEDILEYIKVNFVDLDYSPASINVNRAAIKYYYLVNFKKELNDTLLPYCKIYRRYPYILDTRDVIILLNSTNNLKHKIWIALGYGSGLRVHEIAKLKIGDFSHNLHKIRVVGKGNKERFVPFPEFTYRLLLKYYEKYKNEIEKNDNCLFPSIRKDYDSIHVSEQTIKNTFSKTKKKFNLGPEVTFHTLRHSFATDYIRKGGDVWKLKSMLGHDSINSTMIYLHMANDFSEIHSPLDEGL